MTAPRSFALAAVLVVLGYLVPLASRDVVDALLREDGPVETAGALGFFAAGVCFLVAYFRSASPAHGCGPVKRLSFLVLALVFFVGAGEEISWGQRLLGYQTPPALGTINAQGEVNVHNLTLFDRRLVSIDRLFWLFWSALLLGVPLLAMTPGKLGSRVKALVPVFPITFGLLFLLNYTMANVVRPLLQRTDSYRGSLLSVTNAVTELKESVYALLFAAVGLYLVAVMMPRLSRGRADR